MPECGEWCADPRGSDDVCLSTVEMGSVLYTNQQAKFERKKEKNLAISSNKLAALSMEASALVLSSNLDSRWQVATSRTREQEGHGGCRCSRLVFWASVCPHRRRRDLREELARTLRARLRGGGWVELTGGAKGGAGRGHGSPNVSQQQKIIV